MVRKTLTLLAWFQMMTVGFAGAALALSVDFATLAVGNEGGGQPLTFNLGGGLSVSAYGFYTSGENAFAYLDDEYNSNPGGLGVAGTLDTNLQAVPSSDDNVTPGEKLKLYFHDGAYNPVDVLITGLTLRNGSHLTDFLGTYDLSVDDTNYENRTLVHEDNINDILTDTLYLANNNPSNENPYQFYLSELSYESQPVPEPGTILLLALGLGSLGWARYRRH